MNLTYVDVEVHNKPRVSIHGSLPRSLSCDLIEGFLSEVCENSSDTFTLIREGDTVLLGEFEVSLSAEDIIKIKSHDQQVFYLSFGGLCELCRRQEALLKLAVTERIELGVVEFSSNTSHTSGSGYFTPDTGSQLSDSEFTGHAYQNIEEPFEMLDIQDSGFGMIMQDVDTFNELGRRDSQFQTMEVDTREEGFREEGSREEGFSRGDMFEIPSTFQYQPSSPTILDYRSRQDSSSPVRGTRPSSPVRFGRMDMTLRGDQGDKPGESSHSGYHDNYTPSPDNYIPSPVANDEEFLVERGTPLPYGKSNVIGALNETLQKKGEKPADIIVTPHSQTSFSAKVFFSFRGVRHEYESDTRFRNKKDARTNAAHVGYVALSDLIRPAHTASPLVVRDSQRTTPPGKCGVTMVTPTKNYKNLLQEFCQKNSHPAPEYTALDVGDQHSHAFEATVSVKLNTGRLIKETSDRLDTKKAATFQAAARAYNSILGGHRLGNGTRDSSPQPSTPAKSGVTMVTTGVTMVTTSINWKNKLQELFQKNSLSAPKYTPSPGLEGFKSTVYLELEKDGSKSRRFTSDLKKNVKAADMHAAELAYRALAENTSEIGQIGRTWDFRDWHNSSKSKVKFNYGREEVEGEEKSSKKAAENSATQSAIQVLKSKGLWDIADL
ncbi:uncharacterized protein LOC134821040 [Bolinopsis microptera]|uniref:uncharacterized protein LOC134821040 n=1 Tax=Bolinopsis microptera TaxID=2820187 RepID=UPI003079D3B6